MGDARVNQPPGRVVIISGPSGSGKTTVVKRLLERSELPLVLSVSATTRPPRQGEVPNFDYRFLSPAEFQRCRESGEFLEAFEVYGRGHWYGTLRKDVSTSLQQGKWVVLEIDVQGMRQVKRQYPDAISIFVRPESLAELERRLRGRGTDDEASVQRRLEVARQEWALKDQYEHEIINDELDETVAAICQLLEQHATSQEGEV